MRIVDSNEVTLEIHLNVRQGMEYPYNLDLTIRKDAVVASLVASAKADEYSKELADAAAEDIRQLVDFIRQIPMRGK